MQGEAGGGARSALRSGGASQQEHYCGVFAEDELVVVVRWRVTLLPLGPVTVAVALPGVRVTSRVAV